MKNRRFAALVCALLLCFAAFSSALFIVAEAGHDCVGEDCSICAQIDLCTELLKGFCTLFAVLFVAASAFALSVTLYARTENRIAITPILLKVKLSD